MKFKSYQELDGLPQLFVLRHHSTCKPPFSRSSREKEKPPTNITANGDPACTATPAPATVATLKPTTSHPSSPATVHTSTEPFAPATSPAAATKQSGAPPPRSTSAFYSSDSSDEDVSVGTQSPPSRKYHFSAADFLHDTTPTTSNDSPTMTTPSRTAKTDKQKTMAKDLSLLQQKERSKPLT
ncbi:uncharacterized protein [Procambarus clarkii]|uniref:uncharacterized protein n=1 Tax=Procambarus clarkii TaxID=6728 RepID=UPI00374416AF